MFLYRLLSILLLPIIYLYLLFRLFKGKEDGARFKERFGFASKKRPEGELFWFHSVSVGESNSAMILIEEIAKNNPGLNILLTSTTTTSASQIKNKLINNNRVVHQFLPVDDFFSTRRFIKYWHPDMAIFIESEIWPNLIDQSAKNNTKLALINARISKKSAARWLKLHKIGFNVLKNFKIAFAQSHRDQERLQALGLKSTKFIGNLKSCAKPLSFDEKELESLKKQINNRPFWLASSTHKGEEEIIFRTHQKLKETYPNILTIIAPRHPKRLDEIINLIPKNLSFSIRSKKEKINEKDDFYLANTLGELGLFYKLSEISLICGSLKDNIGGHNPFEAINLGSIVISGQYVANFAEIYENLARENLALIAINEENLHSIILKLMQDQKFKETLQKRISEQNIGSNNILLQLAQILK